MSVASLPAKIRLDVLEIGGKALMAEAFGQSISRELDNLTATLRALDQRLKSNPPLDWSALSEFRQALDKIRLTAWSVSELHAARQSKKSPEVVISFLTAERLRRFSQMARDLSSDLEHRSTSWPAAAVRELENSLALLGARLTTVGGKPLKETR